MELWDEREQMDGLVQTAGRVARLAGHLAEAGAQPNPRTRRAFLTAAEQAGDAVKAVIDRSITVDATALQALEQDLKHVRKEMRAVEGGRTPETQPFVSLLEDARAARRQTTRFFRSRPRPNEAKLEKQRRELLQFIEEENAKYGPPSEEDREAARKLWDQLERELFQKQ